VSARPVTFLSVRATGRLVVLACALLLTLQAAAEKAPAVRMAPDRMATLIADHKLATLDGRTITLRELRGKVVVVVFWASWCAPCRREMPEFDRLNADLAARGAQVVGISVDGQRANALGFVKKHGLRMVIAHDGPQGLVEQLDVGLLPYTMVLDRQGAVAFDTGAIRDYSVATISSAAHRLSDTPALSSEEGTQREGVR
jgi:peroxiredoxin